MESKKVFDETERLKNEITKEKEKLNKLLKLNLEMMNLCNHEIVFKFRNNHPSKAPIDASYFCPACGKKLLLFKKNNFKELEFKNSKVVSLTNLSLFGTSEVFDIIRNEVYNNIDLYYNNNISTEELANRMEALLKEKQIKYKSPELILKNIKKD